MIDVGALIAVAWRPKNFVPVMTPVISSNYGTSGSLADVRRRRTATILSDPDPRLRQFNGMTAVPWRRKVQDVTKVVAVTNRAPQQIQKPLNFSTPAQASLTGGLNA